MPEQEFRNMAHTDKTKPFWVQCQQASDAQAWHHWACEDDPNPRHYVANKVPCDIGTPRGKCKMWSHSVWKRLGVHRPAVIRRLYYYQPERATTRAALKAATRDYNTYGETDIEPENNQHRHTPWGGGWWD